MLFIIALIIGGAAVLSHTAPFPFLLEAFRPARSLWSIEPVPGQAPTIYLTFDDGPNPRWTPALLDALREHGAHGTFFLIGRHITPETAPVVARIAAEGHAIALHSGTREPMVLPPEAFQAQLARTSARIASITGREPCRLFRPHGGWRSAVLYESLERAGYRLAGWSWGMWDWNWWRGRHADDIARRLARRASPGDIVVIHDGHHENLRADRRYAAETIRQLVPALRARGFEFGTLCQPDAARPVQESLTDR